MTNPFRSPNEEMIQRNKSIHTNPSYNQMLMNRYQSLGGLSMAPQGMQQMHPNYPRPINFIQGKYQENNLADLKTQSLIPNVFSSSNALLIAPYRYGQMLPLARPRALPSVPQGQTSYHNIDPIKKNYFNGVNLQAHTSGFPNPSIFHNQNNLLNHPYGANSLYPSHQRNNSLVFNDLNSHPRVSMNSLNGVMDIAKPSLSPPIENQNLVQLSYKDLTRERAAKRFLFEYQENNVMTSASKRPKLSITQPNYYQVVPFGMKELLVSKDEKPPNSTSKIKVDAKKNIDKDNLDLSLHL